MEIIFDNWSDGDVSCCQTIVVRGTIRTNNSYTNDENGDVQVTTGCRNGYKWPVRSGLFKTVVQLVAGRNDLVFTYKGCTESLFVDFEVNNSDLCVVPLYVICEGHDGRFQAPAGVDNSAQSACQRIALGLQLVQCLFAEKLREKGFPRKTFKVEKDLDPDAPHCRIFHSSLDVYQARQLDQEALWERIGREIMSSELGNDRRKFLAILSCTYWNGSQVMGDPALGGGGLALLGSGTLHTWPTSLAELVHCFTDQRKIHSDLLDNSCFRGTYAGCFSTSLGAVCHEVGHMFNLGHTRTGIMSRGFDNVERVFLSVPSPIVKGRLDVDETNNLILVPCLSVMSGPNQISCRPEPSPASMPKEDDLTSLTSSCAAILAHHEWFNNTPSITSNITYDPVRSIVCSDAGLKVVQLRASCGAVLKSWELGKKSPRKHLILPRMKVSPTTLVAINSCGYVLTQLL